VVNLDAVEHFRSNEDRRLRIVLRDGAEVVASRAMSEELRKLAR
jgi:DNA-binding LytR/AlgR family response regulator